MTAYIETDNDYKFLICEMSDELSRVIRLEDGKMNIVIIKINWNVPLYKAREREAPIIQVKKVLKKR